MILYTRSLLFYFIFFIICKVGLSQTVTDTILVSVDFQGENITEALRLLESKTQITFAYNKNIINDRERIFSDFSDERLNTVLDYLFKNLDITYQVVGNQVVLRKNVTPSASPKSTISGYILDMESGEALIGCSVIDRKTGLGTSSNQYGFYSITLPPDSVHLIYSYVGYQPNSINLEVQESLIIDIKMSPTIDLQVVEVVGSATDKIHEETQMSKIEIPVDQIKMMPALLGEVDVLKSMQLLPGVQSGGEGQNGLYVRGGSPDQNLVLLDGVPIYNVSHLLGVFSVFNADAIKNVSLTKGGFPARFGGRLSSILEINMKEGNLHEFHGEGSLGLISSKLTLEGPIQKGTSSFLISARRTYADLIFGPIVKSTQPDGIELKPTLYFYDLNLKLNHKFNDKHRIYLSSYMGSDVFRTRYSENQNSSTSGIDWGNIIGVLRWNYKITNKLFSNLIFTHSNYDTDIVIEQKYSSAEGDELFSGKYLSGIQDWTAKIDFDYIPSPKHYIKFGLSATRHRYRPGALSLKETTDLNSIDTLIGSQEKTSKEIDLYIEDEIKLGRFSANLGTHLSAFVVDGKTYSSFQPRISMRYLFDRQVAIKASFSTMNQYINLLTSESLSLPTDLWVPSTGSVKPQESWQAAIGIAKSLNNKYECSVEGYYKKMKNVLSFKEGASFLLGLNNDWQSKITQGQGEAYGLELFLQKKTGKLTGWIGYTLSWNNRQFALINDGNKFPFRYDRRHDISLVGSYKLSKKVSLSAAWVFGTGNSITLPIYRYATDYNNNFFGKPHFFEVQSLGKKNDFRMSDYHRLDISVEFYKKKRKFERKWIVGLYNAYWHKNPYFITAERPRPRLPGFEPQTEPKRQFKEISILPIIPSVSYAFKF